jgi:glutamate---cysteine ligase / carboxylate-amine ligase
VKAEDELEQQMLEDGFANATRGTLGAEEELMLLRAETFELAPEVPRVLSALAGDERFTDELPASQVEIRTVPCATLAALNDQLVASRRDLAKGLDESFALAGAGVHPLAPARGELNPGERFRPTRRTVGDAVLERQLVFAFQVHVAPGDPACALAVYNALRSYLPEIAGLAANAPFLEGADTGLASVRPQISLLLPRQGVPPSFSAWREFTEALDWEQAGALMPSAASWWWEVRPRPSLGTLEVRVPDTQTTLAEASVIAALVHCLVMWLGNRHLAGEKLPVHASWRIAENRWLAARDGGDAELVDLDSGVREPLRQRLAGMLEDLAETASALDCVQELEGIEGLVRENGAARQRAVVREEGIEALPAWLASRFLS